MLLSWALSYANRGGHATIVSRRSAIDDALSQASRDLPDSVLARVHLRYVESLRDLDLHLSSVLRLSLVVARRSRIADRRVCTT